MHLHPPASPEAPLTYTWTDGWRGQTPAPPIVAGYEDYVAACCNFRLPGVEPPAWATNPPPTVKFNSEARAYIPGQAWMPRPR